MRNALDQLVHQTQGRFQYEFPPDPRDRWKDRLGNEHPAPHPRPGMVPPPQDLQLDLTAGSGSVRGTFSCLFFLHAVASHFTFVPLLVPYFSSENIV